jgi:hypothetical protein
VTVAEVLISYETSNEEENEQLCQMKFQLWNIDRESSHPTMPDIFHWFYPNYLGDPKKYIHCYASMARVGVYQIALRGNRPALGGFLSHLSEYGVDVQCAALNCISSAWRDGAFSELWEAQQVQLNSKSSKVRTLAFNNLTKNLDNYFSRISELEDQRTVQTLLKMLPHCSLDPLMKEGILRNSEPGITESLFVEQILLGEQEFCARVKFVAWLCVAAFHPTSDIDMNSFEDKTLAPWSHWLTWGSASSNVSPQFCPSSFGVIKLSS